MRQPFPAVGNWLSTKGQVGSYPQHRVFHISGRLSHASYSGNQLKHKWYMTWGDTSPATERTAIRGWRTRLTFEPNSCSGNRPLPHNSLQKGPDTSGTQSSNIPAYQLPKLTNVCVSEITVSRDPEKDLLNILGSTSVLTLQSSLVSILCLSLFYSRSGFVSSRDKRCDKITSCSPINIQL